MAAFSPIVCTFIFLKVEFSFALSFSVVVVVLRLTADEMFFASFSAPFPFRCSPSYSMFNLCLGLGLWLL